MKHVGYFAWGAGFLAIGFALVVVIGSAVEYILAQYGTTFREQVFPILLYTGSFIFLSWFLGYIIIGEK